jgi:hypothetical protein
MGYAILIVRRATYPVEEPTLQRYLLLLDRLCDFNCPLSYLLNADYFMAIHGQCVISFFEVLGQSGWWHAMSRLRSESLIPSLSLLEG